MRAAGRSVEVRGTFYCSHPERMSCPALARIRVAVPDSSLMSKTQVGQCTHPYHEIVFACTALPE